MKHGSEKRIQYDIKKNLKTAGFSVWDMSQPRATKQTPGFPDLFVCGHGRILFIECKAGKNTLTPAQRFCRSEIEANGGTFLVWRSGQDAIDYLTEEGIIH